MGQTRTGKITEQRVRKKLESLGLEVRKPYPDIGVDLEAWNPENSDKIVKIQVKGRNPKVNPDLRWFQIRVSSNQLELAESKGLLADETWKEKVRKADFFVLDAVKVNEMYVLSRKQVFELIKDNEQEYIYRIHRSNNFFNYEKPLKQKQKEMNLDIKVNGVLLRDKFSNCKNNFGAIKSFLEK